MSGENSGFPDESYWFHFSATLRIYGQIHDLDEITETLGLVPTHTHIRGDLIGSRSRPLAHDMWSYTSHVPEDQPLDLHLQDLWAKVRPHQRFLIGLKERLTVNVFCGYRTNCETAGIDVSHRSLQIFMELEIPFSLSVIV